MGSPMVLMMGYRYRDYYTFHRSDFCVSASVEQFRDTQVKLLPQVRSFYLILREEHRLRVFENSVEVIWT